MITLDAIQLDDNLIWVDEYRWTPIAHQQDITLNGTLIVQQAAQLKGRPITLEGGDGVWIPRSALAALVTLSETPGQQMILTLHDGRSFHVIFRHGDGLPLEATPVIGYADPEDGDPYTLTLRLMEI